MNNIKKLLAVLSVTIFLLSGCGAKEDPSLFNSIPEIESHFPDSEVSEYTLDKLNLRGITIKYSESDTIRDDYDAYINELRQSKVWVVPVFDGTDSWCYQNEDKTLQLAINIYEDGNTIDISIREIE